MLSHAGHPLIATESAPLVSPFDDPECRYAAFPTEMQTFVSPAVIEGQDCESGPKILERLAYALDGRRRGEPGICVDLAELDRATQDFLQQTLGHGEISVLADRPPWRLSIRESVFPGIWRVLLLRDGVPERDYLDVGAVPATVLDWADQLTREALVPPSAYPPGLMNAPALVHEIHLKVAAFQPGHQEVFNLTLLPMTPDDLLFLANSLGLAGLSILSTGYGDCRVSLTRVPNVWWVQYFNSTDQLILNTIELTAVPRVVLAAPEDFEDSAQRLREFGASLE